MTWWASFNRQNLPNSLSILRGILGALLPFLLLRHSPTAHVFAFFVFIFGAVTDYWDGWLARRHQITSDFGKIIDPSMDKILILVPMVTFALKGFYSIWWVVPIAIREVAITFCRIAWLLEGKAAGAERLGKLKFGFQVAAVSMAFLFFLNHDFPVGGMHLILDNITLVLMIIALALTLASGVSFLHSNRHLFHSVSFARFTSACGVGLIPFMPGTWGSLLGLLIACLSQWNPWLYLSLFFMLFAAGYWAVGKLDLSENKDPSFVVMDEVLGMMLTLMFHPLTFSSALYGFLLFRLFDITKPYPLRRLEKLPGYWGILLDDLGAGIYGWLVLFVLFQLGWL